MALATATVTYDLADQIGTDFDYRRTKVWASTNVDGEAVIDTVGNQIRLGTGKGTLAEDGTGSITVWVPGTGSNPATWQNYIHVDYPDAAGRVRKVRTFGPFTITTSTDLADLVAEQEVPPTYLSQVTAQLQVYVDEAQAAADLATDISEISTSDGVVTTLINNPASTTATTLADMIGAKTDPLEVTTKHGDPWWTEALRAPIADDTPTITVASTGAISGGTTVVPTADYNADAHFRYDGCIAVTLPGAGRVAAVQPLGAGGTYTVIPETVTSQGCDKIDVPFTLNAAGATVGIRVYVNGRMVPQAQQWFASTASAINFVRISFPSAKARSIRVEATNVASFNGVVVPSGETVTRPAREVSKRLVVLADSYGKGANSNSTNDPATNGCSQFETFVNYVAKALGCDSIINLAVGGTGWLAAGGSDSTFGGRIADVLAASPHIVIAAGSRNDTAFTGAQVYAAATAALGSLADVPVVLVCGLEDDGSVSGTAPAVLNEAVKQAARTVGRPFHDMLGVVTPALKNTADNVHPSINGAKELGRVFYNALDRPRIDSLVDAANGGRASIDLALVVSPSFAAAVGAMITLTATQSTTRAGTVAFYANGALIGTAAVSGGIASMTISSLAAATYTYTARFFPSDPSRVKPSTSNPIAGYVVSANLGFVITAAGAAGALTTTDNAKAITVTGNSPAAWARDGSGHIVPTPPGSGTSWMTADAGTPNGTYTVPIAGTITGGYIVLRHTDASNLLRVRVSGSQIVIESIVANVTTLLYTGTGGAWASGETVTIVLAGNAITVKRNGANVTGLVAVSVPDWNTKTRFGLGAATSATAVTFGDLSFVAA